MKLDETAATEVLRDILEELGKTQKVVENLGVKLEERDKLIERLWKENEQLISGFEEKYNRIEVKAPKPDLTDMNRELHAGLANVTSEVAKRPASITRQFRVLFFPENNPEKFYKMVFGRLIPWIFSFIITYSFLSLGHKSVEAYTSHQYSRNANIAAAAWVRVYEGGSKTLQDKMGKAWKEAEKQY